MLNDSTRGGSQCIHSCKALFLKRHSRAPKANEPASRTAKRNPEKSQLIDTGLHNSLKRTRSREDIDGEDCTYTYRKKRRLSLDLVTSRLSPPFSAPATHIIGTRTWRVGAWARQRFVSGKLLRKAAILNFIAMTRGRRMPIVHAHDRPKSGSTTSSVDLASTPNGSRTGAFRIPSRRTLHRNPQTAFVHVPSSYEAFDYEFDESDDEDSDEKGDDDTEPMQLHSDFSLLDPSDTETDFYDTSWSFASFPDTYEADSRTGGKEINLVLENESSQEISFLPGRPEMFQAISRQSVVAGAE